MADFNRIAFCPECDKLLHYKEDFEKTQFSRACNKCGYKERAENALVYFEEYPENVDENEHIPVTKNVRCPYCGHGQAGFFEEWIENKANIAPPSAGNDIPMFDHFDSDSGEEQEIERWKKERLSSCRKSLPDERNLEAIARWEEKLRDEEATKRAEIHRRKKLEKPEARRALIFVCLNTYCCKTWEGD